MEEQKKISVVINTYNAEEFLAEVLESVKEFDETVVCDMESTDRTVEIAQAYGCRVVTFPKDGIQIVEPARDFAIHQTTHPWVLVVDADEIVTPALRTHLYKLLREDTSMAGYSISRHNKLIGRFTKQSGHDYVLRFFKKDLTTWPPTIHSLPVIQGEVARLPQSCELMHLEDQNLYQWVKKMNDYTDYEMEKKVDRDFGVLALLFRPLWRFFRCYVLRGAFRDGRRGLIQSLQWAIYQQILVAKMMERKMRERL